MKFRVFGIVMESEGNSIDWSNNGRAHHRLLSCIDDLEESISVTFIAKKLERFDVVFQDVLKRVGDGEDDLTCAVDGFLIVIVFLNVFDVEVSENLEEVLGNSFLEEESALGEADLIGFRSDVLEHVIGDENGIFGVVA